MHDTGSDMIAELETKGVSRRDFVKVCTIAAGAVGLPAWAGEKMAETVETAKRKPSVIWLHFQECTGCTESLLRTSHPDLGALILDLISVDYHETLAAAAGYQIEKSLEEATRENKGKYVLVVEGAIPVKENGIYCRVAGKTAVETVKKYAADAAAVIAIGSCASWGGVPSASPNPTGASGVSAVLGRTVLTLPGCPANPYNLLGTVLQYATFGTLPKLDEKGRPEFAYKRVIHDDCPRRAHFDNGRFAKQFGDEGHRQGWCLYQLGCKGPQTHANCSLLDYCETPGAWPIGIGHPCVGCTEQGIGFNVPISVNLPIERPTAPMAYPGIHPEHGVVSASPVAVGVGGAVIGALVGAAVVASRKLSAEDSRKE